MATMFNFQILLKELTLLGVKLKKTRINFSKLR